MVHSIKAEELVVPYHGSKEVKTGTLNAILKQAGIKTTKR
jgi:predicted RNA binding protein YcfA (HicA-like mRNA interferase family)